MLAGREIPDMLLSGRTLAVLVADKMNVFDLNQKLISIAEQQKAIPPKDRLTALVDRYGDAELKAEDLEMVSAAGAAPNYQAFLRLLQDKLRK